LQNITAIPSKLRHSHQRHQTEHHQLTQLTSIQELLQEIKSSSHEDVQAIFARHSFVGTANDKFVLAQFRTRLYVMNLQRISESYFYERVLTNFSRHQSFKLEPPLSVYQLLEMALQSPFIPEIERFQNDREKKISHLQTMSKLLIQQSPMLQEYFGIEIKDEGLLSSLPTLVADYTPPLLLLPLFLWRLATKIDWTDEKRCFRGIATEISKFFAIQSNFMLKSQYPSVILPQTDANSLQWWIEHRFFPALKQPFNPPISLINDGAITQVACLEQLYKIFERC
jgi:DNA mismatch repair protein MLH1